MRFIVGHNVVYSERPSLDELTLAPGTRAIALTQGQIAIVDADDYEWLSQWRWFALKSGNTVYAGRGVLKSNGKQTTIRMHQVIAGNDIDRVDHKDRDGLNNTRGNLRLATNQQNLSNRGAPANNTSGFKGVTWSKKGKKWYAQIGVDGKHNHLGSFAIAEEAARAYDQAARILHGEFSRLNFEQEDTK